MDGHVLDEPEGDLCRYGFPASSRHACILPNAQREENPDRTTCTRAEMGVRLFKKILLALVDTTSQNLDQTTLAQITHAQLMRKAATVRNTQVTLSGKTPMELTMGHKLRDVLDPASMNPQQLTSTPTKQDLLNEEIRKLALKTHLEVQQREDIRRHLVKRMKFVPRDIRAGEHVFYW